MSSKCHDCDRKDCKRNAAAKAVKDCKSERYGDEWEVLFEVSLDARADCDANRVDWRARALTEAARADAAEARIADTSREARLIGLQANKAQAIARDPFWAGAQKAAQNLLARLEPKP